MDDKKKYDQLILKITKLRNLYIQILKQSVEVGNDINKFYDEGMEVNLYNFFEKSEDVELFIRLMNVLQYVAFPKDQDIINELILNVLENNIDRVNTEQDLIDLLNISGVYTLLLKHGEFDKFQDNDDFYFDYEDDYEEDDYEEFNSFSKKRILH